ncbi:hypothetical protein ES703_69025 [subsurface metagenome]
MRSFNSFQPFPERARRLCRGFLLELFSLRDSSLGDFPELRLSHRRQSSHRLQLTRLSLSRQLELNHRGRPLPW